MKGIGREICESPGKPPSETRPNRSGGVFNKSNSIG